MVEKFQFNVPFKEEIECEIAIFAVSATTISVAGLTLTINYASSEGVKIRKIQFRFQTDIYFKY